MAMPDHPIPAAIHIPGSRLPKITKRKRRLHKMMKHKRHLHKNRRKAETPLCKIRPRLSM